VEPGEIDPVKYGVLWQRVTEMDKKMDKMERQLEDLLALANKGRAAAIGAGIEIAPRAEPGQRNTLAPQPINALTR